MNEAQQHKQVLAQLYRELILANAANPCGHESDIDHTHGAEGNNPLCGDAVDMRFEVRDGVIINAAFHGDSCAICMASGSLLCRHLTGESPTAVKDVLMRFKAALEGGPPADCPEFLRAMLGVSSYPARIDCALLPWQTACRALDPEFDAKPA